MTLKPTTVELIDEAFNLMDAYITYIKEKSSGLHWEADGTPSCEQALKKACLAYHQDKKQTP